MDGFFDASALDALTLSDNSIQTRCSWTVLEINLLRFFVALRPSTLWDRFDTRFNWFDDEVFFIAQIKCQRTTHAIGVSFFSFSFCEFGITRFFVPFYWNSIKRIGFSVKLKPTNRHKIEIRSFCVKYTQGHGFQTKTSAKQQYFCLTSSFNANFNTLDKQTWVSVFSSLSLYQISWIWFA